MNFATLGKVYLQFLVRVDYIFSLPMDTLLLFKTSSLAKDHTPKGNLEISPKAFPLGEVFALEISPKAFPLGEVFALEISKFFRRVKGSQEST